MTHPGIERYTVIFLFTYNSVKEKLLNFNPRAIIFAMSTKKNKAKPSESKPPISKCEICDAGFFNKSQEVHKSNCDTLSDRNICHTAFWRTGKIFIESVNFIPLPEDLVQFKDKVSHLLLH